MAFRFQRRESLLDGFHRVVREETASVVSMLADHGSDMPDRIHEARRGLKRLRALLRLVRSEMESETFDVEDMALRDAGKKLSPARDADVALGTFTALAPKLTGTTVAAVRSRLRAATKGAQTLSQKFLASIASAVRESGHTLAQTGLAEKGWALIEPGLADSYKSSWKMRRQARRDPSPSILHEWRKLVKRLSFQMDLLRRCLDHEGRKIRRGLVTLGDLLGELNDLDLLRTALVKLSAKVACPPLDALVAHRWKRAQKRVFRLARNIFAATPAQFIARVKKTWRKWHAPPRS